MLVASGGLLDATYPCTCFISYFFIHCQCVSDFASLLRVSMFQALFDAYTDFWVISSGSFALLTAKIMSSVAMGWQTAVDEGAGKLNSNVQESLTICWTRLWSPRKWIFSVRKGDYVVIHLLCTCLIFSFFPVYPEAAQVVVVGGPGWWYLTIPIVCRQPSELIISLQHYR